MKRKNTSVYGSNSLKSILISVAACLVIVAISQYAYIAKINFDNRSFAASVKGTVTGTVSVDPTSNLYYGGWVSFKKTIAGTLKNGGYVLIRIGCTNDAGNWVYQYSRAEVDGFKFPLTERTGLAAIGLPWKGEAANCNANLEYWYPYKSGRTWKDLDNVTFRVEAKQ